MSEQATGPRLMLELPEGLVDALAERALEKIQSAISLRCAGARTELARVGLISAYSTTSSSSGGAQIH